MAAVCVRLTFGPINLDFLRPVVDREFATMGGNVTVHADHIYAQWDGIAQPMRLVLSGLRIDDARRQTVATAPSVALSFEPGTVLKARFLPTAIVVDRPTLDAEIAREGGMLQRVLAKSDTSSQGEMVDLLIEQLMDEPNYTSLLGQLDTVRVERGRLTVKDIPSGVTWVAPDVQAQLRRDASGVIISASARFSNGGSPVDVDFSATYSRDRSRISAEAKIAGLKPAMLADLSPNAGVLRGIDVALAGRMHVEASGAGDIHSIAMEVTGGNGTLTLPGVLPVVHKVHRVSAAASVDAASHTAKIDRLILDLGAAKVTVTGQGVRTEQGQSFKGRAEVTDIPIDQLAAYWPLEFAKGGRNWAVANLSRGTLDVAAEFGLSAPGGDFSQIKLDQAVATLAYRGMRVHYMPHMPELEDVTGTARYENATLHFDVNHGTGVGLTVSNATIDLNDLDRPPPQVAKLHMPITGTAAAANALLARPKLGLPKDMLYDPKRLSGDVSIDLTLSFPLLNAITVADLDIRAEASLSHFGLKGAIGAVDLTEATGRILYENSQLNVTGAGKFDGSAVDIFWREQFGSKATYRRRYELKGTIPASLIAKAGFLSIEPYITGPMNVTSLSYQVAPNGTGEVQARLDLKAANSSVPQLGWSKEAGVDSQLTLGAKLAAGGKLVSAEFEGRGGGLEAKGTALFSADNVLQQITIAELAVGRTDISADWRKNGNNVDIDLRGRSIELPRVRQALKGQDEAGKPGSSTGSKAATDTTHVALRLDQVLVKKGSLGSLSGQFSLSGDRLVSADLALGAGRGGTFRVQPVPAARNVALYITDFGQLLHEAGWLDGLAGGYLDFRGFFNDSAAGAPLSGTLKLGPYRLQKVTPRPDVDSLNSTIDGLNRAGNALQQFDGLEAQILKTGDRIDVKNGRTSGQSIGLTTSGYLDLANDTARLRGLVVPGFALNNLLSNVPLLGPLITGGKGAGIFAISYRLEGPFDDLKSDINMMSAVTPGALRELFNGSLDGTSQTKRAP
ncbi:AsmA-like C-terminal region [Enhydrobacter aerosaccus]|uniref:AsmA-like C-terminal region n=1 Tax=Enhydrobacter aerosaccus TaxID=225324 RepID=A0A1T4LKE6_9HYPH|nr:DUF3971 domain-containing protein [Enhydrobacter aerosaccus]SJZ55199.1 AsmA-like C-terminal region [Enhydrobacter aerosaccus]